MLRINTLAELHVELARVGSKSLRQKLATLDKHVQAIRAVKHDKVAIAAHLNKLVAGKTIKRHTMHAIAEAVTGKAVTHTPHRGHKKGAPTLRESADHIYHHFHGHRETAARAKVPAKKPAKKTVKPAAKKAVPASGIEGLSKAQLRAAFKSMTGVSPKASRSAASLRASISSMAGAGKASVEKVGRMGGKSAAQVSEDHAAASVVEKKNLAGAVKAGKRSSAKESAKPAAKRAASKGPHWVTKGSDHSLREGNKTIAYIVPSRAGLHAAKKPFTWKLASLNVQGESKTLDAAKRAVERALADKRGRFLKEAAKKAPPAAKKAGKHAAAKKKKKKTASDAPSSYVAQALLEGFGTEAKSAEALRKAMALENIKLPSKSTGESLANWLDRVHEIVPISMTYGVSKKMSDKLVAQKLSAAVKKAKSGTAFKHEGKTYYVAKEKDFDWSKAKSYRKHGSVPKESVVVANGGETVKTLHDGAKGGSQETVQHEVKKGDYIVTWSGGDKGVMTPEAFAKAWEPAPDGKSYRATNYGLAIPVKRNTVFYAPWGGAQFIPKGGYAFKSGATGEFYGNRKETFERDYRQEEAPPAGGGKGGQFSDIARKIGAFSNDLSKIKHKRGSEKWNEAAKKVLVKHMATIEEFKKIADDPKALAALQESAKGGEFKRVLQEMGIATKGAAAQPFIDEWNRIDREHTEESARTAGKVIHGYVNKYDHAGMEKLLTSLKAQPTTVQAAVARAVLGPDYKATRRPAMKALEIRGKNDSLDAARRAALVRIAV